MSEEIVIRVVDIETTAMDPPEGVPVELGCCDVVSKMTEPREFAVVGTGRATFVDPAGKPMTPGAQAVHHITPEDLLGAPAWPVATRQMLDVSPYPTALAAHNVKFERAWMTPEVTDGLPWICSYKCAKRLWRDAPSYSNQALRYWRGLGVIPEIANQAHRAGPDAYVTAHLLVELLKLAPIADLMQWSVEPLLLTGKLGFGKHADKDWSEIDTGYLRWMLEPGRDFDEDKAFTARHWLAEHERAKQRQALAAMGGPP